MEGGRPVYLRMMGLNATRASADILKAVRTASAGVTIDKVGEMLLASDWRPRVMGAWYSLAHEADAVEGQLAYSLETSGGSLTAPPLATVAYVLLGSDALPSLTSYARTAATNSYLGSQGFVAAVIQRLGGPPPTDVVHSPNELSNLNTMLAVAEVLRQP